MLQTGKCFILILVTYTKTKQQWKMSANKPSSKLETILINYINIISLFKSLWWNQFIGGSKGGRQWCTPPRGPNLVIVMPFWAKNLQNNSLSHPLWVLATPFRKILDPSLNCPIKTRFNIVTPYPSLTAFGYNVKKMENQTLYLITVSIIFKTTWGPREQLQCPAPTNC